MKAPCEIIMWYILPSIRKEIAKAMIKNHGLNQKEAAKRLGITDAAISQYLSAKRGKVKITDPDILRNIKISAKRIIEGNEKNLIEETCRICGLLRKSKTFSDICKVHLGDLAFACVYCPNDSKDGADFQ